MLIVSEIGLNHDGEWDRAYEMIRRSAQAGADVAKFQLGWRDAPGEINHIPPALAARLKEWCDYWGIEFMASIITHQALDIARELEPARYKIASRTVIDDPGLVEKVLAEDRETFVSLGFWEAAGNRGWPFGPPTEKLRYIYCKSRYPTYPAELGEMPERFSETGYYGFSDHHFGLEASLIAIARGARFVEKHFTLDKAIRSVHNDHILGVTPEELAMLCEVGRPMSRLLQVIEGTAAGAGPVPEEAAEAARVRRASLWARAPRED